MVLLSYISFLRPPSHRRPGPINGPQFFLEARQKGVFLFLSPWALIRGFTVYVPGNYDYYSDGVCGNCAGKHGSRGAKCNHGTTEKFHYSHDDVTNLLINPRSMVIFYDFPSNLPKLNKRGHCLKLSQHFPLSMPDAKILFLERGGDPTSIDDLGR